jgi:hypothetical protein
MGWFLAFLLVAFLVTLLISAAISNCVERNEKC